MKHEESDLQKNCIKAFRYKYQKYNKILFAVPNGGSRNAIEAHNLKLQGVVPGVSDLIFLKPIGAYGSLCIELKIDKGKQSDNQKDFALQAVANGNKYVICRSVESFLQEIEIYLKNE